MLRSLLIRDGAPPQWEEGDALARPPEPGDRLWLDVTAPPQQEVAPLRGRFDLHPVAIDSCLRIDQRPKLEEYRLQLFVVLHKLVVPAVSSEQLTSLELH